MLKKLHFYVQKRRFKSVYRPLNIHFLYNFDAFIAHSRLNSLLQWLIDMRKCRTISPDAPTYK